MRLWRAGVGRGLEGVREHTSNPYGCASRTTRIIRNGPLVCCVVYCAWCVCVCMYVGMYVCVCVCGWGGRGGYFNDSWVGMHRWYPKTLSSAGIRPNPQNLSLSYIRYFPETTEVDTLFDIKPSYREINFVL